MPEITLKERRVQLVFTTERPGLYFDTDKFTRSLNIEGAKVRYEHYEHGSEERRLTVTVPFDSVPHPGQITDAWDQHWEQAFREQEHKSKQEKLECDNIRETGFSAAEEILYGR
jgi:hypothetical protein